MSIAQIEPNRNKTVDESTLLMDQDNVEISSSISKWFEWSWPIKGQFAGYIRARSLPHIGVWTDFRPEQIATFYNRPSPIFSEPSKPKTAWTMPIYKRTGKNAHVL